MCRSAGKRRDNYIPSPTSLDSIVGPMGGSLWVIHWKFKLYSQKSSYWKTSTSILGEFAFESLIE